MNRELPVSPITLVADSVISSKPVSPLTCQKYASVMYVCEESCVVTTSPDFLVTLLDFVLMLSRCERSV